MYQKQYTSESEFEISVDGQNCVINKYIGNLTEVSIPPYINGKKVVGIGGFHREREISFFKSEDISVIQKVIIPTSVTTIHGCAFQNCKKLHTVIAHSGIEEIGDNAFCGCINLKILDFGMGSISEGKVMLPKKLKKLGSFSLCDTRSNCLFNEVIMSKRTKWKKATFGNWQNAFKPNSCALFYYEDKCTDIEIDTVKINSSAYTPETDFVLGNDGPNYVIESYKGDKTVVVIPPVIRGRKVTKIGTAAFMRMEDRVDVEEVTIPETITEIGSWAFLCCGNLQKVFAHPKVTYIGDWAFLGCENLRIMDFGMGKVQPGVVKFPKKLKKIGARAIASDRGGIPCLFDEITLSKRTKWDTPYWDLTQPAFKPGSCKVIYYEDDER